MMAWWIIFMSRWTKVALSSIFHISYSDDLVYIFLFFLVAWTLNIYVIQWSS